MGPGHFGIALALKPAAPKAPLWMLLLASEALDLLCFGYVAVGMETTAETRIDLAHGIQIVVPGSVPWSHGLFMSVVWSVLAAALTHLFWRDRRASAAMGLVVFSHWVLDFLVHIPDLPLLFASSPLAGLGLWGSGPGLIIAGLLELALIGAGLAIYLSRLKRQPFRRVV